MKKKNNYFKLIITIVLIVFLLNFLAFHDKAIAKIKIKEISEEKFSELNLLINNSFFDERKNQKTEIFNLMYYALSEDGKYSSLTICDTPKMHEYDCIDLNEKYLTKKKCEKISRQNCVMIINQKKLQLNNKSYILKEIKKENFKEIIKQDGIAISKIKDSRRKSIIRFAGLYSRDLDD